MELEASLGLDYSWNYHRNSSSSCKFFSLGESFNVYFEDEINSQGSNFIIIYSKEPNLFYANELQIVDKTPGIAGVSPIK